MNTADTIKKSTTIIIDFNIIIKKVILKDAIVRKI